MFGRLVTKKLDVLDVIFDVGRAIWLVGSATLEHRVAEGADDLEPALSTLHVVFALLLCAKSTEGTKRNDSSNILQSEL